MTLLHLVTFLLNLLMECIVTVKILMLNHPSISETIILTHVILLFTSNNLFRSFVSIFIHETYISIALFIVKSLLAFGINITLDS